MKNGGGGEGKKNKHAQLGLFILTQSLNKQPPESYNECGKGVITFSSNEISV